MSEYKTNYLKKVIFRLDFLENIVISDLQKFSEPIKKTFPTEEEKTENAIILEFISENEGFKNKTEKNTSWLFHSVDKKKRLGVGMHYLYIEYDIYNNFLEMKSDIEIAVKILKDSNIKAISRIGLRYTNEIKLDEQNPLDWSIYINAKLLSAIEFIKNKKISRIMSQIMIREESGDITFNYGVWNKEYPNEINEKEFLLDFDCHSKLSISIDEAINNTQKYHSYIEELFESSIEQQLKDKMNS